MDDLVKKIKQIAAKSQLEQFEWEIPDNCSIDIPKTIVTGYQQNVYLKDHFHSVISNDHELKSHYWAIQKWGKIGSFKKMKGTK